MAVQIILKNSAVKDKNPTASQLADGEIALNYHESGPYLSTKDTTGDVWSIGGVAVAAAAPGSPNEGRFWFNTADNGLRVFANGAWRNLGGGGVPGAVSSIIAGNGINIDQSTGDVTISLDLNDIDGNGLTVNGNELEVDLAATQASPTIIANQSGLAFNGNDEVTGVIASAGTAGIVRVGANLAIDANGILSAAGGGAGVWTRDGGAGTLVPTTGTDVVIVDGGTTAAPTLSHTGDLNTGISFPANNQIGLSTDGVDRVFIQNDSVVVNEGGNDVDFRVESNGDANLIVADGDTDRVGIGTAVNAAGAKLEVAGDVLATGLVSVRGTATGGSEIRLAEDTDNGTNTFGIQAPAALAANRTYIWPSADPAAGQQLTATAPAAGVVTLSWAASGAGGLNAYRTIANDDADLGTALTTDAINAALIANGDITGVGDLLVSDQVEITDSGNPDQNLLVTVGRYWWDGTDWWKTTEIEPSSLGCVPLEGGEMTGSIVVPERVIPDNNPGWDLLAGPYWRFDGGVIDFPASGVVPGFAGLIRVTGAITGWANTPGAPVGWQFPGGVQATGGTLPSLIPFYVSDNDTILVGVATEDLR